MKITFTETSYEGHLNLEPETPAEFAALARFAKNAKAVPPSVHLSFSSDMPYLSVSMIKIQRDKQINSINNKKTK